MTQSRYTALVLAGRRGGVDAVAASEGEVGEALDVGALGEEDDDSVDGGGGSASLSSPQAETAANRRVPVAQEINPSRIFMECSCFLSPSGARRRRGHAGGACIVCASS